jgi:hypothetical protein
MDGDEREVDGGPEGLPPLVVRQAIAAVLAGRLPLAADAVLAGTLGAEQLYALEAGVEQLTDDGHGPDVIAELERRLVGLASARPGADLAVPLAEFVGDLGRPAGGAGPESEPAVDEPPVDEPPLGEPTGGGAGLAAPTVAPDDPTVRVDPTPSRSGRGTRDRAPAGARRLRGISAGGGRQARPLDVARGPCGRGQASRGSSADAHVRWSRAP